MRIFIIAISILVIAATANADLLEPHKTNYFGVVTGHSDSSRNGDVQFQISMKYELIEDRGLYLGYTQKSIWAIHEYSAPFRETNFNPELFYDWNDFRLGLWEHESTGVAGDNTRGWDRSYLQYNYKRNKVSITPKIWCNALGLSDDTLLSENPDIYDYMGYGQVEVKYDLGESRQHKITLKQRSIQYQLDIDIDTILKLITFGKYSKSRWNPSLFIQYFHGYGDTLIDYNKKFSRCTIGILTIR